jgi:hypothetical protein
VLKNLLFRGTCIEDIRCVQLNVANVSVTGKHSNVISYEDSVMEAFLKESFHGYCNLSPCLQRVPFLSSLQDVFKIEADTDNNWRSEQLNPQHISNHRP